jgi:CubicO group peptidase (beta-lactamase class C family)
MEMKNILKALGFIVVISSCNFKNNYDRLLINGKESTIVQKIARVENGLQNAVFVSNAENDFYSISDRMKYYDVAGLSITVIKNNEIEWAKAYGVKSKNTTDSVTLNTIFQAASLSKPVTAIIALKMADEGQIYLDSSINSQLKTWKIPDNKFTKSTAVTPKQLILHLSGLNISHYPGYKKGQAVPSLIEVLKGEKPANTKITEVQIEPYTQWRYSGAGYSALQLLMNEKSQSTFPELMNEKLFKPLGIVNSTFEQENLSEIRDDIAQAYTENGEMVEGGYHIYPEMAAAGLWTTPIDYATIICELQKSYFGTSNLLLNKKSTHYAFAKHWGDMGLGYILRNDGDSVALAFSGGNHGYICDMYSYLHLGSGIVIMTNSNNAGPFIEEIYRSVSREYNWPNWKPDTIKALPVDSVLIKKIIGKYNGLSRDDEHFQFEILSIKDSLYYETNDRFYPLYAVSESEFVIPEQNWRLSVFQDAVSVDSLKFRLEYGRGIAKRDN